MKTFSREQIAAAVRFGLGARSSDMEAMGDDPRGWLLAQVAPFVPAQVATLPDEMRADVGLYYESRVTEAEAMRAGDMEAVDSVLRDRRPVMRRIRIGLSAQKLGAITQAVSSDMPFRERLVRFWTNHFAVFPKSRNGRVAAPYFEQSAIAPYVTAPFAELLLSAVRHPAMQIYLDNSQSVGPKSPLGIERRKGLNENLAREILELHTLGVDGGYTQEDVIELARALTGWTFGSPHDPETSWNFVFHEDRHEPGKVTVLGKTYAAGGPETAELILRDIARHPSTARHLSTKLARHFVADEPPDAVVEKLTAVYMKSDGDLAEVSGALVSLDEARTHLFSKLKQPGDFVVSSLRALDFKMDKNLLDLAAAHQTAMGQPPLQPPGPQGWYDTFGDWNDPSSLLRRVEWGAVLAAHGGDTLDPVAAAERNLGADMDRDTRLAIQRAPSREEAAAILVASPLFQRR